MDPKVREQVGPEPHAALYIMCDNELSCLECHKVELAKSLKNAKAALKRAKTDFDKHNKLVKSLWKEKMMLRDVLYKLKRERLTHRVATVKQLALEKANGVDIEKRYPQLPESFF